MHVDSWARGAIAIRPAAPEEFAPKLPSEFETCVLFDMRWCVADVLPREVIVPVAHIACPHLTASTLSFYESLLPRTLRMYCVVQLHSFVIYNYSSC